MTHQRVGSLAALLIRSFLAIFLMTNPLFFLTSLGKGGGQTSPPIFKIALKKLFHIDSEWLNSNGLKILGAKVLREFLPNLEH